MEAALSTPRLLNWRPDPAHAEFPLHVPSLLCEFVDGLPAMLPPQTDLAAVSPAIYDQGQLGSCTAHAWCGIFEIREKVAGRDHGVPSRLFFYQMELLLQGTWGQDAGSTIPTGARAALSFGLPPETSWPYSDNPHMLSHRPSASVYALGRAHRATAAMEVRVTNNHANIVAMLAQQKPIAAGFFVPRSFMGADVANTGVWGGPLANDPIVGGHAIAIVGHDDTHGTYKIRNSWGAGWGSHGYVTFPQSFVHANFQDLMAAVDAP